MSSIWFILFIWRRDGDEKKRKEKIMISRFLACTATWMVVPLAESGNIKGMLDRGLIGR